jgi:hypothetical protein
LHFFLAIDTSASGGRPQICITYGHIALKDKAKIATENELTQIFRPDAALLQMVARGLLE